MDSSVQTPLSQDLHILSRNWLQHNQTSYVPHDHHRWLTAFCCCPKLSATTNGSLVESQRAKQASKKETMIFVFSNAAYEGAGSWCHEITGHSGDCANEIYTVREPCKVMNEYVWNSKLLFRNTSIMDSFISRIFLCCQGQNGWWSCRIDRLKRPGDVHHEETRRRGS